MVKLDKIKKELKKFDSERVIKYLQIKAKSKSNNVEDLLKTIIKKKEIVKTEEFMIRLKITDYTFMTAPERIEFTKKLLEE